MSGRRRHPECGLLPAAFLKDRSPADSTGKADHSVFSLQSTQYQTQTDPPPSGAPCAHASTRR